MKNIDTVIAEFLQAQQVRLSKKTYGDYAGVMELFMHYLNDYAYQTLDKEERLTI